MSELIAGTNGEVTSQIELLENHIHDDDIEFESFISQAVNDKSFDSSSSDYRDVMSPDEDNFQPLAATKENVFHDVILDEANFKPLAATKENVFNNSIIKSQNCQCGEALVFAKKGSKLLAERVAVRTLEWICKCCYKNFPKDAPRYLHDAKCDYEVCQECGDRGKLEKALIVPQIEEQSSIDQHRLEVVSPFELSPNGAIAWSDQELALLAILAMKRAGFSWVQVKWSPAPWYFTSPKGGYLDVSLSNQPQTVYRTRYSQLQYIARILWDSAHANGKGCPSLNEFPEKKGSHDPEAMQNRARDIAFWLTSAVQMNEKAVGKLLQWLDNDNNAEILSDS